MEKHIAAYETSYSDGRERHAAYQIPWDEVADLLGDVEASATKDGGDALVMALHKAGAPAWVLGAEGWTDECGWGVFCAAVAS